MRINFTNSPENLPSTGDLFDSTPKVTGENSETLMGSTFLSRQAKEENEVKKNLFRSLGLHELKHSNMKSIIARFVESALDQCFVQLNLLNLNEKSAPVEKRTRINQTITRIRNLVLASFSKILTSEAGLSQKSQLPNTCIWKLDLVTQSIVQSVKELDQGVFEELPIENFTNNTSIEDKGYEQLSRGILENGNLFQSQILSVNTLSNTIRENRKVSEITKEQNLSLNNIATISLMNETEKARFFLSCFSNTDLVTDESSEAKFIKNVTDIALLLFDDVSSPRQIIEELLKATSGEKVKDLANTINERLHDPRFIHTGRNKFILAASHNVADTMNRYHKDVTNPGRSPIKLLSALGAAFGGVSAMMGLPLTLFADTDELKKAGVSQIFENLVALFSGLTKATGNQGGMASLVGDITKDLPSAVRALKASELENFNKLVKKLLFVEGPQFKTQQGFSPVFEQREVFDYFKSAKETDLNDNNFSTWEKGLMELVQPEQAKKALKDYIDEVGQKNTQIQFKLLRILIAKQFAGKDGYNKYIQKYRK